METKINACIFLNNVFNTNLQWFHFHWRAFSFQFYLSKTYLNECQYLHTDVCLCVCINSKKLAIVLVWLQHCSLKLVWWDVCVFIHIRGSFSEENPPFKRFSA